MNWDNIEAVEQVFSEFIFFYSIPQFGVCSRDDANINRGAVACANTLNLFFLNYYPDSGITKYTKDHGFLSNDVYEKVMRNEMIGEQSFKGTILDEELAENQVKVAFLFRLATILPASLVIWMWKRETYKFFPTNRMLYYLFSGLCELKGRGIMYLYMIIHLSFSASSFSDLFKGMSESFRRSIRTALK